MFRRTTFTNTVNEYIIRMRYLLYCIFVGWMVFILLFFGMFPADLRTSKYCVTRDGPRTDGDTDCLHPTMQES
jgi:hypothetical protein